MFKRKFKCIHVYALGSNYSMNALSFFNLIADHSCWRYGIQIIYILSLNVASHCSDRITSVICNNSMWWSTQKNVYFFLQLLPSHNMVYHSLEGGKQLIGFIK